MDQLEILRLKARARARMAAQQGDGAPRAIDDFGAEFRRGLVKGAVGMAQGPAQVGQSLGDMATGAIDKYVRGKSDAEIAAAKQWRQDNRSPIDPTRLYDSVNSLLGGYFDREAKTDLGAYGDTTGQFLSSALVGGPKGGVNKIISALSAGGASEAAGQKVRETKYKDYEPHVRLGTALLAGAAPDALRRVVTPNPISSERAAVVNTLKNEGVDLTAGQTTGSTALRNMESELGGGTGAQFMERQGEQFTAAALRRAGIDAPRATPEVMDQAFTRIGKQFDDLAARNNLAPDPQIAKDIVSVVTDYTSLVPQGGQVSKVRDFANDAVNIAQNGATGAQYQAFRSRLATLARKSSDPHLKDAFNGIRETLDDAMERSLVAKGSPDLGAWKKVRNQYRNIIVLEQAAGAAGENAAQGIISPSQLRNATKSKHGLRNYVRGKGDFADLARAGEAAMKPLPNSGTAARTAARNIGTGFSTIAGTLLGQSSGGGVPAALIGGVAGSMIPSAIGRALLSDTGRKYLTNQLLAGGGEISPMRRALIQALAGTSVNNSNPK